MGGLKWLFIEWDDDGKIMKKKLIGLVIVLSVLVMLLLLDVVDMSGMISFVIGV